MSHIVFGGMNINYIIGEIQVNAPKSFNTNPFTGQVGSHSTYKSEEGRTISFKNLCRANEKSAHGLGYRIRDYIYLAKTYRKTAGVLTSKSVARINGNYVLNSFDYSQDVNRNYIVSWEFKEQMKFNVTKKTFRVWGKTSNKQNNNKRKVSPSNNVPNVVKVLLGKCGAMKQGNKGTCVKVLQMFLQSKGLYVKHPVDGVFDIYTKQAIVNLQSLNKLNCTGEWDNKTRSYFQKHYKYPK